MAKLLNSKSLDIAYYHPESDTIEQFGMEQESFSTTRPDLKLHARQQFVSHPLCQPRQVSPNYNKNKITLMLTRTYTLGRESGERQQNAKSV